MRSNGSHPNLKIAHPFRRAYPNEAMALFRGAIRYAAPKTVHLPHLFFSLSLPLFCFFFGSLFCVWVDEVVPF